MKKIVLIAALLLGATNLFAADVYKVNSGSKLKWTGEKLAEKHWGDINIQNGAFTLDGDKFTGGQIVVDMNTMTCDDVKSAEWNGKLIAHLKNDDFFSTDKYPQAMLLIKSGSKSGKGYKVNGDLIIKGISKPVTFMATVSKKGKAATIKGKLVFDRTKYNIRYGSKSFFNDLGDKVIKDEVTLDFNFTASK